jgi:pyruvate dehydrogenase (quinone)
MPSGLHRRGFIQLAATGMAMNRHGNEKQPERADSQPSQTVADITPRLEPSFAENPNTADILIETLIAWGATHVFGVVGDGINSIIEALRRRQDRISYIGVRHDQAAAFMASGFAKHTGRLGVCVGTTGPGAVTC